MLSVEPRAEAELLLNEFLFMPPPPHLPSGRVGLTMH